MKERRGVDETASAVLAIDEVAKSREMDYGEVKPVVALLDEYDLHGADVVAEEVFDVVDGRVPASWAFAGKSSHGAGQPEQ